MTSKTYHQVIPAVHLFLFRENQVLLLRRFQTGYEDGKYSVPAGHVEKNETARDAMTREIFEETGLKVSQEKLALCHVMHRRHEFDTTQRIDFFFTASNITGEPIISEPDKCDELKWLSRDELPQNMVPYIRKALQAVQEKQTYSEFGWNEGEL